MSLPKLFQIFVIVLLVKLPEFPAPGFITQVLLNVRKEDELGSEIQVLSGQCIEWDGTYTFSALGKCGFQKYFKTSNDYIYDEYILLEWAYRIDPLVEQELIENTKI